MEDTHQILLTLPERKEIIRRLEALDKSLAASYDFPFEDLIAYMKKSRRRKEHFREVDPVSGKTTTYRLFFSSPEETWDMLCGRAGYFRVDPVTLECKGFELTVMN